MLDATVYVEDSIDLLGESALLYQMGHQDAFLVAEWNVDTLSSAQLIHANQKPRTMPRRRF